MLPFIKDRLLAVIRCHDNINEEKFFKKHPANDKYIQVYKDLNHEYFYISNQKELIYQIQMGTIEFHPWASRVDKIERPNIMIFDLDPDEKLPLNKLREAVKKVKSVLDELNLKSFLKTSGGKGYHIYVPFSSSKDYESFYNFSRQIAELCENKWPNVFTTNIRKAERNGKIFLDFLRNNRGSTCACPYSIRARKNAPISCPISWQNLEKIRPNEITIKNYKKYLKTSWNEFFKIKQKLK